MALPDINIPTTTRGARDFKNKLNDKNIFKINNQLKKMSILEKSLDMSMMTDQQVDDELRMLKLMVATRGNDEQSVVGGGTIYSKMDYN